MKTSLYSEHVRLNAKIVDFAGYQMPINYPQGINNECKDQTNKNTLLGKAYDAVKNCIMGKL